MKSCGQETGARGTGARGTSGQETGCRGTSARGAGARGTQAAAKSGGALRAWLYAGAPAVRHWILRRALCAWRPEAMRWRRRNENEGTDAAGSEALSRLWNLSYGLVAEFVDGRYFSLLQHTAWQISRERVLRATWSTWKGTWQAAAPATRISGATSYSGGSIDQQ